MTIRPGKLFWRWFRRNEANVHQLDYLFWECTTRCNLKCRHCGSDCMASSQDKDMPIEDFLAAFDTIPKKEIPRNFLVVLTGGEPLLRPDIVEIGKALKRRGVQWGMVSNGFFYDEAMHSKLLSGGMSSLTISLDGLEDEHDWMRGRQGSFQRASHAISIVAKSGGINYDVVTCVNKRNISQLDRIHDHLLSLGVRQWRIFTVIPIGRAKDDPNMHLSNEEFVRLMEFIKAKRQNTSSPMNVTFSCEGYLGRYDNVVRENRFICRAGLTVASVLIDGRICACPNIDRDAFSQGNIYKDNFYHVWNTRFQPFRDRSWARKGMCKDCKVFADCQGNGMHNWHGDCREVINCHYHKTL